MTDQTYKLISWVNHNYIKEIQCGIQTMHASKEMETRFINSERYMDWSVNDTVVVLQGGGEPVMAEINSFIIEFARCMHEFKGEMVPSGRFREPQLNNALTSVVVILSEEERDAARRANFEKTQTYNDVKLQHNWLVAQRAVRWGEHGEYVNHIKDSEYVRYINTFLGWVDSCRTA